MTQRFVYRSQGKQHGPVTADDLRQLAASGTIQRTDLVAKEGTDKWVAAMAVAGLFPTPSAPAAPPSPAPSAPSTIELLNKDVENISKLAAKVIPVKRDRDLTLSRFAVFVMASLAIAVPLCQLLFTGIDSLSIVGTAMLLWTLLVLGMLVVGTIQQKRTMLVLACQMSMASWLFLLLSNAPFVVPMIGTVFSAAAGYWALSVLNRSDVREYYAGLDGLSGTTVR